MNIKYATCQSISFKLIIIMKDWIQLWMFEPNCIKNLIILRFSSGSLNFESLFICEMTRKWLLNSSERLCNIVELTSFPEFTINLNIIKESLFPLHILISSILYFDCSFIKRSYLKFNQTISEFEWVNQTFSRIVILH